MSKHASPGGNGAALLDLLSRLRAKAEQFAGKPVEIVVIQEAGLDGFWIHRLLEAHGIESHVVDPASIAVPRRRRRAKTDAIDGETLLRTLLAWKRGEPRVCAMVVPPTPEQEDRRRTSRERAILLQEKVRHVNRIKGLLAGQGITDYDPVHKDRRIRLAALKTGNGQPFPERLKAELLREIEPASSPTPDHSVQARSSPATPRPQNLTSGRRVSRPTPKFLIPEAVGSDGRDQSLSRHLAARTLCGPPTEIRRGSATLADSVALCRVSSP
jgi:hypothetical protein